MNGHSVLAPSSAPRWRWCSGSVRLCAEIEEEETDASRAGTAAHWVCEQMLKRYPLTSLDFVDKPAPNGVIVDEEMYDAALVYVRDIMEVVQAKGAMGNLDIEEPVSISRIHPDCWGTPDCWLFDKKTSVLYLWDFKYGHEGVDAFENEQLICYMTGIIDQLGVSDLSVQVVARVVQPRCYDGLGPIREWFFTASDVRAHVNKLTDQAHEAMGEKSICKTGRHCKHCPAAHHCVALRSSTMAIIDRSSDALPQEPGNDALGYELDQLDKAMTLLKLRKESLDTLAQHRIKAGNIVPGWVMEQGFGDRKWLYPEAEVLSMGELMGIDLLDKPKLLTPAKADAQCKKNNVDPSVISSYYGRQPTSVRLKRDDGSKARQIFSQGRFLK